MVTDSFITQAEEAVKVIQAKIDNALDAMPPRSRERTEIDVQVPIAALRSLLGEYKRLTSDQEWEYGTRKLVIDGWERGERYGEHEYIPASSISTRINVDRSTVTGVRDMTRVVKRRPAGDWVPVEGEDQ